MINKIWIVLICGFSTLYATNYGLVIGIDNGNLIGAKNDAKQMAQIIRKKGVKSITSLYNQRATRANILGAFGRIVNNANSHDRVYLFFSGHGTSYYDPSIRNNQRLRNLLKNTGALIPWGVSVGQYERGMILAKRDLAPLFDRLESNRVPTIIIFDACFSGSAYKESSAPVNNHSIFYPITTRGADYPYQYIVYMSGATRSDYTAESRSKQRGYFSMDVSHCLSKYHTLNLVRACMLKSSLPSIVLPSHGSRQLFGKKGIVVVATPSKNLTDELFDMAIESEAFRLYVKNQEGKLSQNYNITDSYFVYADNKPAGYLALFSREDNQIKIYYPNNKTIAKLNAKSNKRRLTLRAEPFSDNKTEQKEEFVGFLIDKESAKKLQMIYNQSSSDGTLNKEALQKTINTLKDKGFYGSQFTVIVHQN